jgi:hypothetical protein
MQGVTSNPGSLLFYNLDGIPSELERGRFGQFLSIVTEDQPEWASGPQIGSFASTSITISRDTHLCLLMRLTGTGAKTLTFENQDTSGWVIGDVIYFRLAGTGTPTLAGSGITFNGSAGLAALAQHANFACRYVGTNTWDVEI